MIVDSLLKYIPHTSANRPNQLDLSYLKLGNLLLLLLLLLQNLIVLLFRILWNERNQSTRHQIHWVSKIEPWKNPTSVNHPSASPPPPPPPPLVVAEHPSVRMVNLHSNTINYDFFFAKRSDAMRSRRRKRNYKVSSTHTVGDLSSSFSSTKTSTPKWDTTKTVWCWGSLNFFFAKLILVEKKRLKINPPDWQSERERDCDCRLWRWFMVSSQKANKSSSRLQ